MSARTIREGRGLETSAQRAPAPGGIVRRPAPSAEESSAQRGGAWSGNQRPARRGGVVGRPAPSVEARTQRCLLVLEEPILQPRNTRNRTETIKVYRVAGGSGSKKPLLTSR